MEDWIKCSDRLPATSVTVVFRYKNFVPNVGYMVDGIFYDYNGHDRNATHWMPLPSPPK